MRDLIDRTELVEMLKSAIAIKKSLSIIIGADNDPEIQMKIKTYSDILNHVKKMSPAEQERKTGRWIKEDHGGVEYTAVCSECEYTTFWSDVKEYKFCPNCGGKMEEQDG